MRSWIWHGKKIHILCDEGQIMKVINLMKQAKNSKFYSLVSFTRPHEKPWKRKHSSHQAVAQGTWFVSLFLHICDSKKKHWHARIARIAKTFDKIWYLWPLPTSHCFVSQDCLTWGWDQKSINFDLQFYMLWQYKLDKNFDLTFREKRSLLSSMNAKICFKMLIKSLVCHLQSTKFFNWRLTNFEVDFIPQPFFRL